MNFLKSEWQHRNLFYNAKATNENESADFANFDPKIGCYGNVPWVIEKRGVKSAIYDQNTYDENFVKIVS